MKIKVTQEGDCAYVGVIDPTSGEHRKSVHLAIGQEVELTLPDVHDESRVELGDVVETEKPVEGAPEQPQDAPPAGGEGEPAPSDESGSESAQGLPAGLGLGRIVIYRSKTGSYDLPAVVNATIATIDPEGVKLGHVPPLGGSAHVHLTVFTCGKQGTAREGNLVNNEAAGGSYQEFNIPQEILGEGDGPSPGTWRWPERV